MYEKLAKYLDGVFSPYKETGAVKELKEELSTDLQEKFDDFKSQGYDDETAYNMTVDSIGDVSEMVESISGKRKEGRQTKRDFSYVNLQGSDLRGVTVHDGKFNYTALKGSDFSGADLTNSSFKGTDLTDVKFDGAILSGAIFNACDLKNASFKGCVFDSTEFKTSDLSGVCFDNQTFDGTIFNKSSLTGTSFRNATLRNISIKYADFRKAIFDGAVTDKLTYAVLKNSKADLTNVTII